MTFTDFNLDGRPELIVGSEDYDIRVFQDDELLTELSEADAIISLCSLGKFVIVCYFVLSVWLTLFLIHKYICIFMLQSCLSIPVLNIM